MLYLMCVLFFVLLLLCRRASSRRLLKWIKCVQFLTFLLANDNEWVSMGCMMNPAKIRNNVELCCVVCEYCVSPCYLHVKSTPRMNGKIHIPFTKGALHSEKSRFFENLYFPLINRSFSRTYPTFIFLIKSQVPTN